MQLLHDCTLLLVRTADPVRLDAVVPVSREGLQNLYEPYVDCGAQMGTNGVALKPGDNRSNTREHR